MPALFLGVSTDGQGLRAVARQGPSTGTRTECHPIGLSARLRPQGHRTGSPGVGQRLGGVGVVSGRRGPRPDRLGMEAEAGRVVHGRVGVGRARHGEARHAPRQQTVGGGLDAQPVAVSGSGFRAQVRQQRRRQPDPRMRVR